MQYTQEELQKILEKHNKWQRDEKDGERCDLNFTDLAKVNLVGESLSYSDLSYANLSDAKLASTDLDYTDLNHAKLINTNLMGASLVGANMECTDLENSDLRYADLESANLSYANLTNTNLENACLAWVNTEGLSGYTVYSVQIPTSIPNAKISYWKELDIWTAETYQGTKERLIKDISEIFKDNEKIKNRILKAIEFIESMASEEL